MIEKQQPRKQRFGLRKLSIGVVSVLLGLFFIGGGNRAAADDQAPTTEAVASTAVMSTTPASAQNTTDSASVVLSGAVTSEATPTSADQPASTAASQATSASPVVNSQATSQAVASQQPVQSAVSAATPSVQPVDSAVAAQPAVSVAPSVDSSVNASTTPSVDSSTPVVTPDAADQVIDSDNNNVDNQQGKVQTVDKIHFDQILKDKYQIDVNHLDAKSALMLASLFHIFANEAQLSADVNGNIAVGILNSNVDFGTRGDSVHLTQGDIYYIQQLNTGLQSGSFRNELFNHVVFGQDVNVEIVNGQVHVNGHHMVNLKPEEVFKDAAGSNYIDFPTVFSRLLKASNFYASQEELAGVIKNFDDQNNRFVDVSNAVPKDNVIYVNIPFEYLTHPQPIKIFGLSSKVHGPTVVINVIRMPADGEVSISTQVKLYYDDEKGNHVLWNFGESAAHINIGSGHFMGSLLAPNAHVTAGVNVDGNIIANIVDIRGGESHKWDIHPVEPPSFIVIPDPTETPQPSDPIIVVPPTVDMEEAGTTNPGGNKDPKPDEEPKGDDAPTPQPDPQPAPVKKPVSPMVAVPTPAVHQPRATSPASDQPGPTLKAVSAAAVATNQADDAGESLPQTGSDNHGIILGIALAITAQLMIWGLVKPKKKK
ncbi:collagen-binding domain-containing protein [Limosilactobacillus pontis]|uniref:Choice-of-anchor A family protein n=1 Tax=Limosilactobacillus pontis TaxID=35787 RepID=A0ABU7SRZ6_9LACO